MYILLLKQHSHQPSTFRTVLENIDHGFGSHVRFTVKAINPSHRLSHPSWKSFGPKANESEKPVTLWKNDLAISHPHVVHLIASSGRYSHTSYRLWRVCFIFMLMSSYFSMIWKKHCPFSIELSKSFVKRWVDYIFVSLFLDSLFCSVDPFICSFARSTLSWLLLHDYLKFDQIIPLPKTLQWPAIAFTWWKCR